MSNFAARIAAVAAAKPGAVAIEQLHADGSVGATTYGELDDYSAGVAAWLAGRGIVRGDRVAILADNGAPWIGTYLGILRLGAVAVPLDTAYKAAQVATVLENSGARLIFTSEKYRDRAGAAAELMRDMKNDSGKDSRSRPLVTEVAADDAAVILYTSGTTSDPKGVVLTHANLDAERQGAFAIVQVTEHDAILGVLPLFHALAQMANLLLPLAVGARVVFLDTVSSTTLVSALSTRGITIFACVPQFFYLIHQRITGEAKKRGAIASFVLKAVVALNVRLRNRFGLNPAKRIFARAHRMLGERMRLFVTGGSKFDPAIARDLYGLGFTILNAYGLTETSGGATIVRPGDRLNESVGQPFPGVEIRIAPRTSGARPDDQASVQLHDEAASAADGDESGPASDGDESDGEVLIRGPILMREYFNRPDATAQALKDGWLHTGDLGRLDAEGRLYITGRLKEIIVLASGKNLYPEEIEAHYRQSAFIKELCVLGVDRPGEPSSERLHAVIVPDETVMREKGIVNLKELIRFEVEGLSVHLPAHKRVLSYDISLDPLPRTTTGKVRRHEIQRKLRDQAASDTNAAREESPEEAAWRAAGDRAATLDVIARRLDKHVMPDANLELDLGLDSMERVELLTLLEQRAGARVAAETRATIFTVRQLVEAVESAPRSADPGTATDEATDLPWDNVFASPGEPATAADLGRSRPFAVIISYLFLKFASLVLRITPGLRVSGLEHLPKTGAFLICPNHQAYLDPFFLAAVLPYRTIKDMFYVGASEYFETPMLKRMARAVNLIPVDPDANLVSAMQAGGAGLRMGKVLILFPEGERSIDGGLKKFRKGASILSAHLDVPIVPVALDGLYELWPRRRSFNWGGLLPWRAKPVKIEFGPPIQARRGAYTESTAELRAAVARMFESKNDSGSYKTTPGIS